MYISHKNEIPSICIIVLYLFKNYYLLVTGRRPISSRRKNIFIKPVPPWSFSKPREASTVVTIPSFTWTLLPIALTCLGDPGGLCLSFLECPNTGKMVPSPLYTCLVGHSIDNSGKTDTTLCFRSTHLIFFVCIRLRECTSVSRETTELLVSRQSHCHRFLRAFRPLCFVSFVPFMSSCSYAGGWVIGHWGWLF